MGQLVLILGDTGTGKSRSIKNLDPKETMIINVLGKRLPFKDSTKMYGPEHENMVSLHDYSQIAAFIGDINVGLPHIKQVIIDDARYIMEKEFMKRAKDTGYSKFTEFAQHFQTIIEKAEQARDDLKVVLMMHDDIVFNDKTMVARKVKLVGKMVEDHYNPIEVVSICLVAYPTYDKNDKPVYQFFTQKTKVDGVELPAKSPEEMFPLTIPNDLKLVFDAMDNYF